MARRYRNRGEVRGSAVGLKTSVDWRVESSVGSRDGEVEVLLLLLLDEEEEEEDASSSSAIAPSLASSLLLSVWYSRVACSCALTTYPGTASAWSCSSQGRRVMRDGSWRRRSTLEQGREVRRARWGVEGALMKNRGDLMRECFIRDVSIAILRDRMVVWSSRDKIGVNSGILEISDSTL
jgi:hypothetical protein